MAYRECSKCGTRVIVKNKARKEPAANPETRVEAEARRAKLRDITSWLRDRATSPNSSPKV